jgi:hypothetical protein
MTLVRAQHAGFLAVFFAVGCAAEPPRTNEPDESEDGVELVGALDRGSAKTNAPASSEPGVKRYRAVPTANGLDECGPVPDPWKSLVGPVPDPWNTKRPPDPNAGSSGSGHKKP